MSAERSTPIIRQHRMACGCLWRFTTRMGWFLIDLGPKCPATTAPHPFEPKVTLDFSNGKVRYGA